ncbi:hypothetical protein GGR54DRAFT_637309 [Hypoxylon sp. NC1633]|nr:hypothetical protein GGR54DRAFT_637309 [Hypoxylon sp. NC1633]
MDFSIMDFGIPVRGSIEEAQFTPSTTSPNTTSINQLLRRHCRERLFMPPLHWTDRQLDLLGCQFVSCRPSRWPTQPFSYYQAPLSPQTTNNDISSGDDLEGDEWRVDYNLCRPKDVTRQSLDFCFGGTRFCTRIPCHVFSRRRPRHLAYPPKHLAIEATPLFPLVIWLDYVRDVSHRRLQVYKPKKKSKPVTAVRRIRLRRITPVDKCHDPYIVAALIALAQAQKRWEAENRPGMASETFTTRLVLGDAENSRMVQVYMADVSAAFLNKLAHPDECEPATSLQVFWHEIDSNPLESLPNRLLESMLLTEETEGGQMDEKQGFKREMGEEVTSMLGQFTT